MITINTEDNIETLMLTSGEFYKNSPVKGWGGLGKNVKKYSNLAVMHHMSFVKKLNS